MTSRREKSESVERWQVYVKRAIAYLRQTDNMLHTRFDDDDRVSDYLTSDLWRLLEETLEVAEDIVKVLPDELFVEQTVPGFFDLYGPHKRNFSDDWVERVEKVNRALVERRLAGARLAQIAALENVEGRTPEEAKLYLAKAAELRGRPCSS